MIPKKIQEKLRNFAPPFLPGVYKAHLVAVVALAFVIPIALLAMPFIEFFNDMAVQPKAKTQGRYGRLYGPPRHAERRPVEGTIPMGHYPYHLPGKDEETAKKAAKTLTNPFSPTLENQKEGQKLYNYYCKTCHGMMGEGDGMIIGPDLFPAPPSLHTDSAKQFKDGKIFHIISRGQNTMPSYADKFTPEERWKIVLYVRALQRAMDPKPEDLEK